MTASTSPTGTTVTPEMRQLLARMKCLRGSWGVGFMLRRTG